MLADPRQSHPHHEVARQAYEFGPYFKPQMVHAAYEVFVNDYVTHLHQRYDNLANEETLLWLFKSPNAANNGIHLPAGDCAAALEWKYRAQGSSPADFEAKYQLQVKVWSASSRHGKVVFQRKEATKLCFLEPACAIAARDVGVWEIHMLRNGSEVSMKALDVHEPPLAEQPGLTRRFDQHFEPLDEGAAYTSDEYLNYQKSYVPTAPDAHGRQDMTVQFNFRSPKSGHNLTRWGSAFSLTQRYQSNGTTSTLEKRVYDSLYRRGHTYQATTSEGRVAQLSLAGGPGLGSYGNWKLIERIDHHSLPAQTVPVRKILAMAQLPAGDLRQNTGSVAYQIKVATFPEDWNPGDIAWNLKLRNGENNQVLANYEGLFLEEAGEQIRTTVQPWDGLDEETGQKPPAGTMILPELDVHLFSQDTPVIHQLQQSAAFRSGQRAFTVSAAATNAEWYHMAGEVDLPFEVDDDLYIYLDEERIPVWADDDGVRTFVRPRFQASKGQRVRMVAVDSFGLCRKLDGPIYLYHEPSGQRQLLRRFTFDDGCFNWPAGFAFLDIFYTIIIPSNQASPTPIYKATLLGDCFNAMPSADQQFFNTHSLGPLLVGPECKPSNTKPASGIKSVAQIDTANDARGREPYPFPKIQFCSPIPLGVDPTNGNYSHRFVDLSIPTRGLPLQVGRNYVSEFEQTLPNFGWRWDFEEKLVLIPGASQVVLQGADGSQAYFVRRGPDGEFDPLYRQEQAERLRQIDDRHYEVRFPNQSTHLFEIPADAPVSTVEAQPAVLHKKIDRNGNAQTYYWSADGCRLHKIQGPVAGQYLKFRWTCDQGDSPRVKQVADHTGRCVHYEYSKVAHPLSPTGYDWLLTKVVQPGNTTYQHTYHPILGERHYRLLETRFNGELQEKIGACDDQPGALEEVAHHGSRLRYENFRDADNRVHTKMTKSGSEGTPENRDQVTESILDVFGRVVEQIDAAGNHSQVEYDIRNNISALIDSENHRTEMDWDDRHNLTEVRNARGIVTGRMSYSDKNELKVAVNARSETTLLDYDDRSNLIKVEDNIGHTSQATYDEFGLLRSVTNHANVTWTFDYNDLGFLTQKTVPATSDGQPATSWNYSVDSLGRTTQKRDPLDRVYTARYDVRDRLVEASVPEVTGHYRQAAQCRRSIVNVFDRNDLLLSSTALDGRKTGYEYNDCQQLTAVHQAGYPRPTRLEYDSFENLVKMTNNAGQATHYTLDVLNRTRLIQYPNSDTETFDFDNRSNLIAWNRGGQVTTYTYDELSRLKTLDSPATNDSLAWDYDELDRVSVMHDSSGADTTYTYTDNDLLESILRGDGRGISYSYDLNDRLQSIQDHEGDTTAYTFNERNEVTSVTHDSRTVAYGYDLVGRRTSTDLPNGIHCAQAFDERNRLIFLNYQKGSNPVLTYKYGHNQLGQRIVEEKTSAEQCKLSRYCYNPRRELIQSDRRIGNGCNTVTQYRYDLNHNRIGRDQFTYEHNSADQLTEYSGPGDASHLTYNAQGQATDVGSFTFSYNQSQQIKEASGPHGSSTYVYDGTGRRVAKEVNGTRDDYLVLGSEVLKTYQNGGLKARYFLGLGREGIQADGAWKYYLKDGLGSTVALTDESGNSVAAYDFGDYGETTQIAGDSSVYNPFLYTGQEWDGELGMYNLRARHYSPTFGRFIARDPIGYAGGSNLFSYCQGDPIDFADPSGTKIRVYGIGNGPADAFSAFKSLLSNLTGMDVSISSVGLVSLSCTGKELNPSQRFSRNIIQLINFDSTEVGLDLAYGDFQSQAPAIASVFSSSNHQGIDVADFLQYEAFRSGFGTRSLFHEIVEAYNLAYSGVNNSNSMADRQSAVDAAHSAAISAENVLATLQGNSLGTRVSGRRTGPNEFKWSYANGVISR
ncbi:hypothetical protein IV102_36270 [bacterium]|nr:hypothetical protein [bacterium]